MKIIFKAKESSIFARWIDKYEKLNLRLNLKKKPERTNKNSALMKDEPKWMYWFLYGNKIDLLNMNNNECQ